MPVSYTLLIDFCGTVVFAISGAIAAMERKLDVFGVIVLAFATAIGGGTIRDVLIGNTPVTWLRDPTSPILILLAAFAAIVFRRTFTICPERYCFSIH